MLDALQPAAELLSVLGSFAAAPYYARAIGAAAIERRALRGVRLDEAVARTFFLFLAAAALAGVLCALLELLVTVGAGGRGAFAAVLAGVLWTHASGRAAKTAVLALAFLLGASGLRLGGSFAGLLVELAAGYACLRVADAALTASRHWIAGRILRFAAASRGNASR